IKIEYTGMRPGEKLYEEILNEDEIFPEKIYPKIYIGKATQENVEEILQELEENLTDRQKLRDSLLRIANKREKEVEKKKILSVT
ncbi:MAG TPA: polysaccharide biosynthesis protein, partial [Bacillales bacterium]|nr:polysaccharide biosynthesis protein [Bacillales bacterium]